MSTWIEVLLNVPVKGAFTYRAPEGATPKVGERAEVYFGSRKMTAFIIRVFDELPSDFPLSIDKIKTALRIIDTEPLFTPELIELSQWVSSFYLCSHGEALSAMLPTGRREVAGGFSSFETESIDKTAHVLSDEQTAAIRGILQQLEPIPPQERASSGTIHSESQGTCSEPRATHSESQGTFSESHAAHSESQGTCSESGAACSESHATHSESHAAHSEPRATFSPSARTAASNFHYLYGTTGSGKTEVFLQTAEALLKRNKGVIYLVPEIALTAQVTESVYARFGNTVAVLHSALTPSQKLAQWRRILSSEARVVIGARSAVFAPVPNLGLIIIDEEHDGSYKSGTTPRYHARQVAMHRSLTHNIPLVMGSATPSVEAWKLMNTALIQKHTLTKRLAGGSESKITVIDLSKTKTEGAISPQLEKEIIETKKQGRQTILFLNRRGFTHFFRCNVCGFELMCKNCSVPLTLHKSEQRLRCHYCGYSVTPPTFCPECNSLDTGYAGFGTEFIEQELSQKFPSFKTIRIDTDSLGKKGELGEKLSAFKNGDADILLGTQMVAKGLNFPLVKLVGILNADSGLHMPDFRSAERTFSLIVQVAGRAGRFFPDGKVFVQSYSPQRSAVCKACTSDFDGFYEEELKMRELTQFPPFTRLIRLVFRSKIQSLAEEHAEAFASLLRRAAPTAQILGPGECPLSRISNNYRYQLLLRGRSIAPLQKLCAAVLESYKTPPALYIEADVDPINLL